MKCVFCVDNEDIVGLGCIDGNLMRLF